MALILINSLLARFGEIAYPIAPGGVSLYLQEKLQPDEVHASHCTDLNSKIALSQVANLKEVGVGD